MTFGFSGFGKSLSLLGGGHSGGHSFGGKGGLFGGKGGLFGGKDQDCDRDDDRGHQDGHGSGHNFGQNSGHDSGHGHGSGSHGSDSHGGDTGGGAGGGQAGTGWPSIPANTAGITFHVDYEGDGVTDNAIPVGRSSDTKTFEDYLAKARDQVATDNPDVDPKKVIFKATITTQSGEETYYHVTGLEEDSSSDDDSADDDGDDDHSGHDDGAGHDDGHGDDHASGHGGQNCSGQNGGGHGNGGHGNGSHGNDGHGHADFFQSLMCGSKSFDQGHDDDDDLSDDDEDDRHHGHDFDFC